MNGTYEPTPAGQGAAGGPGTPEAHGIGHSPPATTSARWLARWTALGFAVTGVAFLTYPVTRPWFDETTLAGAAGMASTAWIVAHLAAVAGFILFSLNLLGLRELTRGTRAGGTAIGALLTTWTGVGLTLPYYGAEVFGVREAGAQALRERSPALLIEMTEAIRFQPAAVTMFAIGLGALGVGAVLAALTIRRSGLWARWSGVPMALGFALFIPQFFTGETLRIAHGALIAAGCLWVATELLRRRPQ